MKKEIIFMKIKNGTVGFTYHKKFQTLKKGQTFFLENVSDLLIPQEIEEQPLHISNPWKIVWKDDTLQIFEQNKSNPWLIAPNGILLQKGTFNGQDISYLEKNYGIGNNCDFILKRYHSRKYN